MKKSNLFFLIMIMCPLAFSPVYEASAHSLFNSSDEKIGTHRVQIATLPEIPAINEKSQILFRVLDNNENEVAKFRMGVRIYYNDVLIDSMPVQYHENGHWETNYVFTHPGIHIFRVDLYDVAENGGVLTYTFNVGTLSPFGYIFYYVVIAGGFGGSGLVIWSILPRRKKVNPRL